MIRYTIATLLLVSLFGCSNSKQEIQAMFPSKTAQAEWAYEGYILYSDSAQLKVRVDYDVLKKYKVSNEDVTEFPKGMFVTFFDLNGRPSSFLSAKYAIRKDRNKEMISRDSVVLYNQEGDKLETSELIWDEKNEQIYTDKYVRISQSMRGDTSYGYGFRAKQDFSTYEIGKFSGKGSLPAL